MTNTKIWAVRQELEFMLYSENIESIDGRSVENNVLFDAKHE